MRRKSIFKGIVKIILLLCIIGIVTAAVKITALFRHDYVPIGDDFSLDDLGDDQAVMGMEYGGFVLVVNKEGKWKCANRNEITEKINFSALLTVFDAVLRDENIPYQDEECSFSKGMLTRAINVTDFGFPMEALVEVNPISYYYYVVAGKGEERHTILFGRSGTKTDIRWDVNLLLMRLKLNKAIRQVSEYFKARHYY